MRAVLEDCARHVENRLGSSLREAASRVDRPSKVRVYPCLRDGDETIREDLGASSDRAISSPLQSLVELDDCSCFNIDSYPLDINGCSRVYTRENKDGAAAAREITGSGMGRSLARSAERDGRIRPRIDTFGSDTRSDDS